MPKEELDEVKENETDETLDETPSEDERRSEKEHSDVVTLSRKEWEASLRKMAQLEAAVDAIKEDETPQTITDKEVEELTPRQFLDLVKKEVKKEFFDPLREAVSVQAIRTEIKEAAGKYKDFFEYKEDVLKVAQENLAMSIEDAYLFVKAKKLGVEPKEDRPPKKQVTKERHPVSEKPGVDNSAVTTDNPKTIREAALRAAESMGIE